MHQQLQWLRSTRPNSNNNQKQTQRQKEQDTYKIGVQHKKTSGTQIKLAPSQPDQA